MSKVTSAVDFINSIRKMDPIELNNKIISEVGEDLAQFFLNYAQNLIAKESDPNQLLANTSALMLMGYMIRSAEKKEMSQNIFQGYARA